MFILSTHTAGWSGLCMVLLCGQTNQNVKKKQSTEAGFKWFNECKKRFLRFFLFCFYTLKTA